ncbi:aromatic-L-amino-acid decarboxylase-like [Artemia franciscana]|uniref:aromatic-L-amino-acid decarboxylase-like n=1 Tax=Artemia franciscana TaxID=6661 RepID=UPI0032DA2B5E
MNSKEFRNRGKEMVDYIAEYMETVGERRVTPNVEPGYLKDLLPLEAPVKGESWDDIMEDVETKIMPGVTHWQHPRFHAYFPSGNSFPSILGDMLSDGLGSIGFSWAASPACTELETIVLDWFGKMIGLPQDFLAYGKNSKGGGVIQSSASECVLVAMLAARAQMIKQLKTVHPFVEDGVLLSKLIAYCSKEAHSCVEKAAMISFVKLRILDPDEELSLRGSTLQQAMDEDRAMGLVPFFVSCTIGTTSCCSFDNLAEVGPIAKEAGIWMHVDGAYAGNAMICPEFQYLIKGIEHAMSFNTNPNKWLLTNFDISTMWVRDRFKLTQAMVVDPLYLQHTHSDNSIDYRHWGIPLSRRFRALKLWFVIRNYGIEGLQNYIRNHCRLAKRFSEHVQNDSRFEVCNIVRMGLVCFRLKGLNERNKKLLTNINASGKLHMVPASIHGKYVIRFCVVAQDASESDIDYAWDVVTDFATELLEAEKLQESGGIKDPAAEVGARAHAVEIAELMELLQMNHMQSDAPRETDKFNEAPIIKSKPKLAKMLSKRKFSFTETIEYVSFAEGKETSIEP